MPPSELAKESNESQEHIQKFPTHIPVDLLRYILEISATLDRKTTARAIVLSSKLLRSWIDPVLYRTVFLHSPECGVAFAESIKARLGRNPETTFFKQSVKFLSISSYIDAADITSILNACTGVSTLHLWNLTDAEGGSDSDSMAYLPLSARDLTSLTALRHLNCNFMVSASMSPTITHLILCCDDPSETWSLNWVELFRRCPAITHLMLSAMAETREEFENDLDPARLAEDILRAYYQIHSDWSLQLVLVPCAHFMVFLAHAPSEWVAESRLVKDGGGNLLVVYPTKTLDDIHEDELEDLVEAQMDPADWHHLTSDDGDPSRYFVHMFPGIYSDLWEFVERMGNR